jgi:hypothetical protein
MPCRKTLNLAQGGMAHLSYYWTMDETGTADKVDSTQGVVWHRVAGTAAAVPGLFSNGLRLNPVVAAPGHGLINVADPNITAAPVAGVSMWFWFKLLAYGTEGPLLDPRAHLYFYGFDNDPSSYGEFDIVMEFDGISQNSVILTGGSSDPHPNDQIAASFPLMPALGDWHLIVGTLDLINHELKLYLDDTLAATGPSTHPFYPSTAMTLWLANFNFNGGNMDWVCDELGICTNGVVSAGQVNGIWNANVGRTWPDITTIVPYP